MLFFQVLMLAGYSYTHFSQKKLGVQKQSGLQVILMLAALFLMPIHFSHSTSIPEDPTFWLLINLARSAGIPFFILATLSPMLQLWFAHTGHARSSNPFFLYAASNVGSFSALLAYPFLIEPFIDLADQTKVWAGGYLALVVLIFLCRRQIKVSNDQASENAEAAPDKVERSSIARWIIAAFIPSSLLLGSTLFITTDLAPVPLLWIIPLMIFLITFVIAFSQHNLPFWLIEKLAIAAVLMFTAFYGIDFSLYLALTIPIHLLVFFAICLYCHSYLARSKPSVNHLTSFYAWISAGGMLGGIFNTLVAPQLFSTYTEYPLMIYAACVFIYYLRNQSEVSSDEPAPSALFISATTGFLVAASAIAVRAANYSDIVRRIGVRYYQDVTSEGFSAILNLLKNGQEIVSITLLVIIILSPLLFMKWIRKYNLAAAVLLMFLTFFAHDTGTSSGLLYLTRNFFGKKTVVARKNTNIRILIHGSTNHGAQDMTPDLRRNPLSYYHRAGPTGDIFSLPIAQKTDLKVGIIGLGVGAMAAYSKPGNEFTFYEIDPDIIDIAASASPIFAFISDFAEQCRVICGDGRLKISEAPEGYYDMIFLDAFSSDAIPIHLLTAEAIEIYLARLKPDGIMALHISNCYLDLHPVMKKIADTYNLKALIVSDTSFDTNDKSNLMRLPCRYVIMAKSAATIEPLRKVENKHWTDLVANNLNLRLWTDSYSSLIPILKMSSLKLASF